MEDFKLLLTELATDPTKALQTLKAGGKSASDIEAIRKEYIELDRTIRPNQVGQLQQDKPGKNNTTIKTVRLPSNWQKKIVVTSAAWELGEPVTLIPNYAVKDKESQLAKLIQQAWRLNRMDSMIFKGAVQKKSETQVAYVAHIVTSDSDSKFQKVLQFLGLAKSAKEIKIAILENSKGIMYPYFNQYGSMQAFTWEFNMLTNGKDTKHTWVYTDQHIYKIVADGIPTIEPHGFNKIPIVYDSQDRPEYYDVQDLIDRREVTMSRFCDSNDRTAYPLLKTYGKLNSLPDKNDNGKVINFPMEWDEEAQKHVHGDAEFLTYANAPEAIKLEMDLLDGDISYISSTPILSMDHMMKSGGNVATATVKLMFLDAHLKAKGNESTNRTMIERLLSVITSGIITTTNTGLKAESEKLYFDIEFNSVLPGDLKEAVDIAKSLNEAGLASKKTLIRYIDLTEDAQAEMEQIKLEKLEAAESPSE